ncbi:hypothetical protein [Aureimonas sp. SK2]|uniref:hypothetical protein n=1 Tax=Aureimonas sp. SK2 TaxID=3015992 RepID=UPI002444546B|nr:hypothetical protein [Aureimonas sp. SK2]
MRRELGSVGDQRELSPLLVAGHTYRECMRLLGWPYGRVSEAARAIKGLDSDAVAGRRRRDDARVKRARVTESLRQHLRAAGVIS